MGLEVQLEEVGYVPFLSEVRPNAFLYRASRFLANSRSCPAFGGAMGSQNSISRVETREGGKYHLSSFGRKGGSFLTNSGCNGTFDNLASMKGPALNLPRPPFGGSSGFWKDHELVPHVDLLNGLIQALERAPLVEVGGEDIPG